MPRVKINSKGRTIEQIFRINEEESNEILEMVKYGMQTYQTPNKIIRYLNEKLGNEIRKLLYAVSMLFFTLGYQRGYEDATNECDMGV